jgi:hypothetical protein
MWLEAAMVTITPAGTITKNGVALPVGGPPAALVSGGDLLVRERGRKVVSTGFRPLDALLPSGGVRPGSLVEWLADGDTVATGGGTATLAFAVACRLATADVGKASDGGPARPRTIVVVDRSGWFHPPAVLPWLADERRLVVARPARDEDEIWAIDQALRCTGVAAVLAWPRAAIGRRSRMPRGPRPAESLQQWSTAMRRWQLAAAASGTVGLFVRPCAAIGEPSWAEARIAVSPQPGGTVVERRLRLTLAGGNWSAAVASGKRTTEITLDLTRGMAGMSRSSAVPLRPAAPASIPRRDADGGSVERSGAACRAS